MGETVTVTAPPPPPAIAPPVPSPKAPATSHFGSTISIVGDYFAALGRGVKRSVTNFARGVANHVSNSFHELVNDPLGTLAKVANPMHTFEQARDAVVGLGTWIGESAAKLYLPLSEGDGEGFVEALGEVGTDLLIAELLGRVLRKLGAGPPGEGAVREESAPRGQGGGPSQNTPPIDMGKQGKHMPGHNNYIPGRSVLKADPAKLARRAGTGEPVNTVPRGMPGFKERVDLVK